MDVEVQLTMAEMFQAIMVGARRLVDSHHRSLREGEGYQRNWDDEIEAALAEMAVAKWSGKYFDPNVGRYHMPDVGDWYIRHTKLPHGSLVIRPSDPDGPYVLVTGRLGAYRIKGVVDSDHARAMPQYSKDPNGRPAALFIPAKELSEI